MSKTGSILLAIAVVAAGGYWGWNAYQKRELRQHVVSLARDASARLRDGLHAAEGAADPAAIRAMETDAKAIEGEVETLDRMKASRDRALVYAAEEYAVDARQLLRNFAQGHRYRQRLETSVKRLSDHMRYANRRTPAWHDEALRLKGELEKDYFNYRISAEALDRELGAYPAARAKLAAEVDPSLLLDDAVVAQARARSSDAAKRAAAEVERLRRLTGAR